ncbi:unnamed protein product [Prorocentrum cordatum]|uniref:Uncharacterized protein n=1 Tax=Prorocentrum cordatum TaxID=2364126 RepID=A0ABN9VJ91_9DINO|nr:unnamed protein product [Polarella glacialis]
MAPVEGCLTSAEGSPSWENVQKQAEQLRDRYAAAAAAQAAAAAADGASAVASASDGQALQQAQIQRQAVAEQAERRDSELREALQQMRELSRECEQLKFRLSLEREAQGTERRRMADHSETLRQELRLEEARVERASVELRRLREEVIQQEGVPVHQAERARNLLDSIDRAKVLRAVGCDDRQTGPQAVKTQPSAICATDAEPAQDPSGQILPVAPAPASLRQRPVPVIEPVALPGAAADGAGAQPLWDDARGALERLRSQFQVAAQQARAAVAAT